MICLPHASRIVEKLRHRRKAFDQVTNIDLVFADYLGIHHSFDDGTVDVLQPLRHGHERPKNIPLHPCHHGAPVCIDGQRRTLCRHPSKTQDGVGHDGERGSVPNDATVTLSCRCVGSGSGRFADKVCLMWRGVDDRRRRLDRTAFAEKTEWTRRQMNKQTERKWGACIHTHICFLPCNRL